MTIPKSPDNSETESKSLININKKSSNESHPQQLLSVSPPASETSKMQDVEIGSEQAPAIATGEPVDADAAPEKGRGGGQGRCGNFKYWRVIVPAAVAILVTVIAVPLAMRNKNPPPTGVTGTDTNADVSEQPTVSQANALPFRFAENLQSLSSPSRNVMAGYGSCGDLLQDVQHALESMANAQIENGRDMNCWWDPNGPPNYDEQENADMNLYPCPMMEMQMYSEGASENLAAPSAAPPSTEDSYGTNTQVEGVDEADVIKSNGEFVFVAYDRELIVIDLDGNVLDRVEVPLPPNATQLQPGFGEENQNLTSTERSSFAPGWGCGGPPQPQYRTVRSLLMDEDGTGNEITLNVITTFDDWTCEAALCGGLTTAFIYTFTKQDLKLNLVASQDINGSYNNARSIGAVNHIVTNANIDTWGFTGSLNRCHQAYWNMTYDDYEQAALTKAQETVAEYAKNIVDGLSWADPSSSSGNECQHVVQISSMTSGDAGLTLEEKRSLRLFNDDGVLQNFVQITSVDLDQVTPAAVGTSKNETLGTGLGTVESKAAGAFMAYYNPEMYATATDLILAGRGWRYDSSGSSWDEHTFLMSFDLGNMAAPKAIEEVSGYLKNQFSMDMFQDHLRVATTNSQQWGRVVDKKTGDVSWEITTNSTSQVVVLQEDGNGALQEVGFLGDLGPGEDIKSVRFIGARGYVVTFRTVDPLYSLDLSDPLDPRKMGELKISGFSEYMHPISGGDGVSQVGDYLLTVGKEANETDGGRVTGTKIAVFDVRNITNPQMVDDFVISNGNGWSSSEASYDHHAFRYLEESKKLIIPLSMYDWENPKTNFDGFVVYNIDVANKDISVTGNVTHSEGQDTTDSCWGRASLPSRSMVFAGNLMTFKSHSIKMTTDVNNLVGDTWSFGEINLDKNRKEASDDGCHGYWPWVPFF